MKERDFTASEKARCSKEGIQIIFCSSVIFYYYYGISLIYTFVSLSIFSYLLHTPDKNFEDSGNELTWAQLQMNTTVVACMETDLWHNSAHCFSHSLKEVSKQTQGITNLCVRDFKEIKKYNILHSHFQSSPDIRGAFEVLLV